MLGRIESFLLGCYSRLRVWVKNYLPVMATWVKTGFSVLLQLYAIGFFVGLGFWFAFIVALTLGSCHAKAAEVTIPRAALEYRSPLIRTARAVWGVDAPVSVFAAQIHTESLWKEDARSPVGAEGLAQFMPSTSAWLPSVAPSLKGEKPAPYNPGWAMRAMCEYDLWLWKRIKSAASACDRMAFTLSAYNGGIGWVGKDRALSARVGRNPDRWFGHVADVNAGRKASAFRENREYVQRIITRQHLYIKAGWGRGCAG